MIAGTFGNLAMDAILEGRSGLMTALVEGCYTLVPIPDPSLGPRLAELDINPLRVQGSRAVAADARARWVA